MSGSRSIMAAPRLSGCRRWLLAVFMPGPVRPWTALLDPAQGIHERRDVAFRDGRVSAGAVRIEAETADAVVDVVGWAELHGPCTVVADLGAEQRKR